MPLYLEHIGVPKQNLQMWAGIVSSANFFCAVILAPIWGMLADRTGRKIMALRAVFGLSLAIGCMGFATNVYQLLALRLLQGMLGGFIAAVIALAATTVPQDKLGHSLGFLQTSLMTGSIVGPLVGGALADVIGYRRVFLVAGAMCISAGLVMIIFVKEKFVSSSEQERYSFFDNLRLLKENRTLRGALAVVFLTQIALMIIQPILPLYVQSLSRDKTGTTVGLIFAMPALAGIFAAPFWGKRGDQHGHRKVLPIVLLGASVVYVPQAFVSSAFPLLFLRLSLGLFTSGVSPSTHAMVGKTTKYSRTAGVFSLVASAQLLGNLIGPLAGGFLATAFGMQPVFLITSGFLALGSFVARTI